MNLPPLSLILGGVASGKSAYAEGLVVQSGRPRLYLATATAHDGEMQVKIAKHQAERGPDWQTIEAPFDLSPPLANAKPDEVILLDCATLWLSNQLMAENDLTKQTDILLAALANCAAPVVVVSNEVGQGGIADNPLARQFANAQGQLNQRLAAQADLVVQVIAGLPMVLKGDTP